MIRAYKDTDLDQVIDIWHKSSTIAHPFLQDAFVEKVRKAMHQVYIPKSRTWVYEREKEVIGFISMNDTEIVGLFLLPDYFGQGIGTQLVNYVMSLYEYVEVEVFENNTIGRAFYDKYGFSFLNKYYHKESAQAVLRLNYSISIENFELNV